MGFANSYKDLIVYQKARMVAKDVFEISKSFPKEETYSLIDQVRRSSRSVGAQIAEAWAKRPYEKHFISKLSDADGEQQETQHWIDIAVDCGYNEEEVACEYKVRLSEIGRMLQSMMDKAGQFCLKSNNMIRENFAEYFVTESIQPLNTEY